MQKNLFDSKDYNANFCSSKSSSLNSSTKSEEDSNDKSNSNPKSSKENTHEVLADNEEEVAQCANLLLQSILACRKKLLAPTNQKQSIVKKHSNELSPEDEDSACKEKVNNEHKDTPIPDNIKKILIKLQITFQLIKIIT